MKNIILPLVVATGLFATPVSASQAVSDSERVQMQAAMQKSISSQLIEGQFLYFDKNKLVPQTLYPAKSHPMILTMGDHFILCSDFRNADGKSVNVDFYVARRGSGFIVYETVIDNRGPIKQMMKAGKVRVLK